MRFLIACTVAAVLAVSPVLAAERTVTDDTGREVTVPEHPQRIVVMHEPLLGIPLMDLGLEVTGSYGRTEDGEFVIAVDFIDTVLGEGKPKPGGFGPVGQPDLEKLRALEPDLILATELDAGKVDQLATVAPVYLQNIGGTKVHGFDVQEDLAALVGQEEAFAARKAAYLERVAQLHASLPANTAGQTYLPIFLTDQLNVVGNSSGMVQALEDLGYTRLEVNNTDGTTAGGGSMMLMPLSTEAFGRLNPDVLVLLNNYMDEGRDEAGTRAKLGKIVPGWDRFMKPALEDRILFVDPAKVITPTVASAEHMLDAVENWSGKER
ncbi:ABC transporter substrate-binding protein [Roseibium marinum]|uniref:Iron complex transport system substrate-binding protein n=1 Tax=Roseibium marinum TaxID=281252 RepID=A0A2S3UN08_9HYPH|nr:ABC transporter substrate-binding protein [Roseibium marinum]POF29071.1 iron complex transport system substrate-binding protein [Roseibium marinum]